MKTLTSSLCFVLGLIGSVHAAPIVFTPNPGDLGDLDHHNATTWGISWNAIPAGHVITSATLRIDSIWDWRPESDALFIRLLDDPKKGVRNYADNTNDNVLSDYFSGQGLHLLTWSDPNGGHNGQFASDLVHQFSPSELAVLTAYMTDSTAWNRAAFGFGFDPDCHYFNRGVSFEITTAAVPDSASTLGLLGVALIGFFAIPRSSSPRLHPPR